MAPSVLVTSPGGRQLAWALTASQPTFAGRLALAGPDTLYDLVTEASTPPDERAAAVEELLRRFAHDPTHLSGAMVSTLAALPETAGRLLDLPGIDRLLDQDLAAVIARCTTDPHTALRLLERFPQLASRLLCNPELPSSVWQQAVEVADGPLGPLCYESRVWLAATAGPDLLRSERGEQAMRVLTGALRVDEVAARLEAIAAGYDITPLALDDPGRAARLLSSGIPVPVDAVLAVDLPAVDVVWHLPAATAARLLRLRPDVSYPQALAATVSLTTAQTGPLQLAADRTTVLAWASELGTDPDTNISTTAMVLEAWISSGKLTVDEAVAAISTDKVLDAADGYAAEWIVFHAARQLATLPTEAVERLVEAYLCPPRDGAAGHERAPDHRHQTPVTWQQTLAAYGYRGELASRVPATGMRLSLRAHLLLHAGADVRERLLTHAPQSLVRHLLEEVGLDRPGIGPQLRAAVRDRLLRTVSVDADPHGTELACDQPDADGAELVRDDILDHVSLLTDVGADIDAATLDGVRLTHDAAAELAAITDDPEVGTRLLDEHPTAKVAAAALRNHRLTTREWARALPLLDVSYDDQPCGEAQVWAAAALSPAQALPLLRDVEGATLRDNHLRLRAAWILQQAGDAEAITLLDVPITTGQMPEAWSVTPPEGWDEPVDLTDPAVVTRFADDHVPLPRDLTANVELDRLAASGKLIGDLARDLLDRTDLTPDLRARLLVGANAAVPGAWAATRRHLHRLTPDQRVALLTAADRTFARVAATLLLDCDLIDVADVVDALELEHVVDVLHPHVLAELSDLVGTYSPRACRYALALGESGWAGTVPELLATAARLADDRGGSPAAAVHGR